MRGVALRLCSGCSPLKMVHWTILFAFQANRARVPRGDAAFGVERENRVIFDRID